MERIGDMLIFAGIPIAPTVPEPIESYLYCIYLTGATYWAIIQGAVRAEQVGAASGFVHLIANSAGIIGPAVTGATVHATGAFTSAFLLAGGHRAARSVVRGSFREAGVNWHIATQHLHRLPGLIQK